MTDGPRGLKILLRDTDMANQRMSTYPKTQKTRTALRIILPESFGVEVMSFMH